MPRVPAPAALSHAEKDAKIAALEARIAAQDIRIAALEAKLAELARSRVRLNYRATIREQCAPKPPDSLS